MSIPSRLLAFALLSLAPLACSHLTAADATAIEAVDVAACAALSAIPIVGSVAALACVGEETNLRAALDRAVVAGGPDAGDAGAVATAASAQTAPRVAVHRRHGRRRVHVGYVPAGIAYDVQRALWMAEPMGLDAGAEGGR